MKRSEREIIFEVLEYLIANPGSNVTMALRRVNILGITWLKALRIMEKSGFIKITVENNRRVITLLDKGYETNNLYRRLKEMLVE